MPEIPSPPPEQSPTPPSDSRELDLFQEFIDEIRNEIQKPNDEQLSEEIDLPENQPDT